MKITATKLNKRLGKNINQAIKGPVIIESSGKPIVVMISYERYLQLEDAYWGRLATEADKEKSLDYKETMDFLQNLI